MAGRPGRARNAAPGSADALASRSTGSRRPRGGRATRADADAGPDAGRNSPEDPDQPGCSDQDDPESVARLICLRLLTAAPRTHAELATALRRRGVPDHAAQAVLARFAEVKLIDDAMFARAWVDSRHHSRGLAGRALSAELRRRGVGQDDIASALEELDPEQELATARELVDRRLAGTRGQPGPARMRRLAGMLARKGYAPGLTYRVVREALEQEATEAGRTAYYVADLLEPDGDDEEPDDS
jgi:regulatory protein